jgi:hypothetical protein
MACFFFFFFFFFLPIFFCDFSTKKKIISPARCSRAQHNPAAASPTATIRAGSIWALTRTLSPCSATSRTMG